MSKMNKLWLVATVVMGTIYAVPAKKPTRSLAHNIDSMLYEIDAVHGGHGAHGAPAQKASAPVSAQPPVPAEEPKPKKIGVSAIGAAKKQIAMAETEIAKLKRTLRDLEAQKAPQQKQDEARQDLLEAKRALIKAHRDEIRNYRALGYTDEDKEVEQALATIDYLKQEIRELKRRPFAQLNGESDEHEEHLLYPQPYRVYHPHGEEGPAPQEAYKFFFAGFIRSDLVFDTRQAFGIQDPHVVFFPAPPIIDPNKNDIFDTPQLPAFDMLGVLNVSALGPQVLGAQTMAMVESAVHGPFPTNSLDDLASHGGGMFLHNSFILHMAFFQMLWDRPKNSTALLLGYYWHPFTEHPPVHTLVQLSAPFEPVQRAPQFRVTQQIGPMEVLAALVTQNDFKPRWPMQMSMLNAHLQLRARPSNHLIGIGLDYGLVRPRIGTLQAAEELLLVNHPGLLNLHDILDHQNLRMSYKANELVQALSGIGFIFLNYESIAAKFKVTYASNLVNQFMVGGYGVVKRDSEIIGEDPVTKNPITKTGEEIYSPLRSIAVLFDFALMKKFEPGISIGFTKALGLAGDNKLFDFNTVLKPVEEGEHRGPQFIIVSRFRPNIGQIVAIAPRIKWHYKPLTLFVMAEYVRTTFGTINECALITCPESVQNIRLRLGAYYYF